MLCDCRIRNFRNFSDKIIHFGNRLTIISGPNGSGKTSVLEAVYFASCGRSFRSRNIRHLVMFSENWFRIQVNTKDNFLEARFNLKENKKEILLDNKPERLSTISSLFPFFIFNQRSLDVVRGGRKNAYLFFNKVLSRLRPGYIQTLSVYRKALNNKRLLLKKGVKNDMIQAWNRVLEEHREKLTKDRNWLTSVLNDLLPADVQISYIPSQPGKTLDSFLPMEQHRQLALAGSHLDRYRLLRQGKDVREFASSGQQKRLFFDVMTAVGHLFHQQREIRPVLLLDDFDSEFDRVNTTRNLNQVMGQFQVVLTTTDFKRFLDFPHRLVQLKTEEKGNIE
ncbi:MAG: DNA replication/repair protein RecF [Acidobacteria bacterium]|nr:DNA replication/repair protein RecF [Acidobacteriota bacterium]